ncbi:hypothetical protein C7M84_015903, partial [Penaeus vannamei]
IEDTCINCFISESGRRLHAKLVSLSQRLFEILIAIGIRIPKIKCQTKRSSVLDVPEESSCELPSELATSEVDSHIKSVLHPNFVRERIAGLAYQRLNKERQKKHEYRPESIPRNEKNENEMTINLLQDNQESTKNKISETHKQLKYVHTRKVTIASGPRTMLARRPRHVGKPKKHSVKNQVQEKLVESESKKLPRNTQSRLLPLQRDTEQLERLQHQLQSDEAVVEQENEVTVAPAARNASIIVPYTFTS